MAESEEPVYKPETDEQEMVIKPHCECSSCHHWSTSLDWCTKSDFEYEDTKKNRRKERRLQPLLRSEKHPGKPVKIVAFNYENLTNIERKSIGQILIHGQNIPEPMKAFSDLYFHKDIQANLQLLDYKYALPLQSFAWPAILRNLNVFMVDRAKSGKTMAYLPALCSYALDKDLFLDFAKHKGPTILILCPNSRQCEEIFDLIKKIYLTIKQRPKVSILTYPVTNINNMDILITLPATLMNCLKSKMFTLKRLCYLVLENAHVLLKNSHDYMDSFLKCVEEMLEHRINGRKVQLIVTSEKWNEQIENLLKTIYQTPLVCIGNPIEAALYGKINAKIKFLHANEKLDFLKSILKDNFHTHKTIVICDNLETKQISTYLKQNNINNVCVNDGSSKDEIEDAEERWSVIKSGNYFVLICTDFVFDSFLTINDAMSLVHFSFPTTWTRFTKRFNCLLSRLPSPLDFRKDQMKSESFMFVDETCNQQMPKILNLFKDFGKTDANLRNYELSVLNNFEQEKLSNNIDICANLKLFGKCPIFFCPSRHLLNSSIDDDPSSNLPKTGRVSFRIIEMIDVTHYMIQIIEENQRNETINDEITDYFKKNPTQPVEFIEENHYYAHSQRDINGETFSLCKILKKLPDNFTQVKLTTTGQILQTLNKKLHELPQNLKPVEMYLANLMPPYRDENFSARAFYTASSTLENFNYKSMKLTGKIQLRLNHTLWLDNIQQILKINNTEIVKFNLTKHLINSGTVEYNPLQMGFLRRLCEKNDIKLAKIEKKVKKPVKIKDIDVQRAFLDEDGVSEVFLISAITPDEFYVQLTKFHNLLENLQKDIQQVVKSEILHKDVNVEIGKYYLGLDPRGCEYSRIQIVNIDKNQALCFYVDYGDEAVLNLGEIRKLPNRLLRKLPFQAIQCSIHGISPIFDEWHSEIVDVFYKYQFEPETDVFRTFYVKCCDKKPSVNNRAEWNYSIILKDGYDLKLINELLVETGLALAKQNKFEDFDLNLNPVLGETSPPSSDEEVIHKNDEEVMVEDEMYDFQVFNVEEFLEMLMTHDTRSQPPPPPLRQLTYDKAPTNQNPIETDPDSQIYKTNHLIPDVYWSQTDQSITLKIKLIGVNDYKINVIRNRIFSFWAKLDEKIYEFKFTLNKFVKLGNHSAMGQEVKATLTKKEPIEWLNLTSNTKRLRYIHYEIPDNAIPDEPVEKLPLALDISDDENFSDVEEDLMYNFLSDLDSEFDQEAEISD